MLREQQKPQLSQAEPFNILIVDDNQNNLFTLRTAINDHLSGVDVIEADSGNKALRELSEKDVHLIIMDMRMPGMDDLDTEAHIRRRTQTRHIPIVFLTAEYRSRGFQREEDAVSRLNYRANAIDTPRLIRRISTYLRSVRQERQRGYELEQELRQCDAELLEVRRQLAQVRENTVRLSRANEGLIRARQEADAANLAKSQFLADMSHELRTPLNAIIGYSEILIEDLQDQAEDKETLADNPPLRDLHKIADAGKYLLSLINNVLDLSKVEAGKMLLYYESFDLGEMLQAVLNAAQPMIAQKGNELRVEFFCEPGTMRTDLTKLQQILINLLGNAGKFTENGTVTLSIAQEWHADTPWMAFRVTDTGIGIHPEQLGRLFQPFTQAEPATSRQYGGTGLGLTISKRFAEMMGGTISVVSEEGAGSTFSLHLPMQPSAELP